MRIFVSIASYCDPVLDFTLRQAAAIVRGRSVAANVKLALVVPGSGLVKRQAEEEGLDKIFKATGFK